MKQKESIYKDQINCKYMDSPAKVETVGGISRKPPNLDIVSTYYCILYTIKRWLLNFNFYICRCKISEARETLQFSFIFMLNY